MYKEMKTGFTLIELLVVVLIIGILSAVALPQYQKAVAKSRFATLKPIAKAIKDAQEYYYNEHGYYATSAELEKLPIAIPEGVDIALSSIDKHEYISVGNDKLNNRYRMYFDHSEDFAGNIYCEAKENNSMAKSVCEVDQGKETGLTKGGYELYLIAGNSVGGFVPVWTREYDFLTPQGGEAIYVDDEGNKVTIRGGGAAFDVTLNGSYLTNYQAPGSDYPARHSFEEFCTNYPFVSVCQ